MSDLRHLTITELLQTKQSCKKYITDLQSKLTGQKSRLYGDF